MYRNVITAVPGTPTIVKINASGPITVAAIPLATGSALIEWTISSKTSIDAGAANWFAWTPGTVVTKTLGVSPGTITGIRLTATTVNATAEIAG